MRTRQLLLSNLPRRRRGWTAFEDWQRAAAIENEALASLETEEWLAEEEWAAREWAYSAAHAATEEAFKPLAPLVKTWWTVPHGY